MTKHLCFAMVLVAASSDGATQTRQRLDFEAHKSFRCDFTESEGRRTPLATGITSDAKRETFSDLVIDNVQYDKRTARFIGNAGSEDVVVFDGPTAVSFLEEAPIGGNVNVLSIFKRSGSAAAYRAAYSRHTALTTGDITISQSYGVCRGLI